MQECRREINESLVASNRFSTTVMRKEQHNLRNHFEALCKKLGAMIECVEPVTRGGCGDKAAVMMLRFITVGFSRYFEQLYSQLGISDQLPASCKSLLSLRRRIPEPRVWREGWTSARRHQLNLRCPAVHLISPLSYVDADTFASGSCPAPGIDTDAWQAMRLSISDLDLRRLEFCLGKRTKAVGILIGVVDFCFLTTAFVKCVQLLWQYG
ncbi:hypothetical protein ANCCAN_09356 [Ancylostoma caninum]|uniref:Uncharacterized protein n=1 Tax=Ancylostoma caninum TaxID=29170 RepID=A0A368GJQ4_ANCCA|nr:hypothetical protein ANCCAN_09356 [Ancylostoma caninum]